MVSFAQMLEQLEKSKSRQSPLMSSGEDNRALIIAKVGKDLHDEEETPFWDEFISLCGNSDGLAQLLGVSKEKVTTWPARIREVLDRLEKQTAESPGEKEKAELIPTGDNGAFTTNMDPNLGDLT